MNTMNMKLGLGLYRHMLTHENFQFARQSGCTHLIVHLANYYDNDNIVPATDCVQNYGTSKRKDPLWEEGNLKALQKETSEYGLEIYGIENFSPADWYDVLLAGPERDNQIEYLKQIIASAGKAGIKTIGYNFSLAGVWGHQKTKEARGGAESTCFDTSLLDLESPIPNGQIWNMTYDCTKTGFLTPITSEELWDRLKYFLERVLPVAEEYGVDLALHPDDPPMERLRGTPRLIYRPELYQKFIDLVPSSASKLELCLGSLQEMQSELPVSVYLDQYLKQKKISYIHFRNVKGKVPRYNEVFVDEGDLNMLAIMKQLQEHNFDGVLVPDHTPLITCKAPWHAGMAFALGYMCAAFQMLKQ